MEHSCGAVVIYKEKNTTEDIQFLILKQHQGHWTFPKGHVELGETDEETALREVKEEAGITVELLPGFKTEHIITIPRGEKKYTYFIGITKTQKVSIQAGEILNYQWLNYEKAYERLTHKKAKEVLEEANNFLKKSSF